MVSVLAPSGVGQDGANSLLLIAGLSKAFGGTQAVRDVSFDVGCGEVVALLGQNGAFLGSTTIRPGRVNVWGTVVGVGILAIGISGIQQFGGQFYVEPLFNGLTLLVAIGIAGYSQRRRRARPAKASKPGSTAI